METEIQVAARKGVAAFSVVVEPGGAGDDKFAPGFFGVVDSLEHVPLTAVLVEFIQEKQGFHSREFGSPQPRWNAGMIPIQIGRVGFARIAAQKNQRKRRLPNLTRTSSPAAR